MSDNSKYILASKIADNILKEFPEDYENIIEKYLNDFKIGHIDKIDSLCIANTLLTNAILNKNLPKPEQNYIYEVKGLLRRMVEELRESDEEQIGRLSTEQRKKYSKIDEDKIIKPFPRLVREGTVGDCPKCRSTTIKRFIWFGMSIGCIQPKCDNYYKLHSK